jgi:uncharacterized membrane protein
MHSNLGTHRTAPLGHGPNPSRYATRAAVLVCTLLGFAVAARLAAYQLHLASSPPDPIFGAGSERVLHSALSRMLPVPDAALGAAAYATEAVLVVLGRSDRAATAPVLVLAYAALASAMGLAAVGLVVYQAGILHAGCLLCLASALVSLLLVVPAWSEARVALEHVRARRAG